MAREQYTDRYDLSDPATRAMVAAWAGMSEYARQQAKNDVCTTVTDRRLFDDVVYAYKQLAEREQRAAVAVKPAAPAARAHRCWECGSVIPSRDAVCAYCGESAASNWLLG